MRGRRMQPADVEAGKRLRARRGEMNLTQNELATALGISYQQLQKYESGMSSISASRMLSLATALKVTPSYFFSDGSRPLQGPPDIGVEIFSTPEGHRLAEAFQRLPTITVRRQVVALVQAIAERRS